MAGTVGFEPTHGGIKTRCLTAWRRPKSNLLSFISGNTEFSIDFKKFFCKAINSLNIESILSYNFKNRLLILFAEQFTFSVSLIDKKWIKSQRLNIIKLYTNPRAKSFYRRSCYTEMKFDELSIAEDTIDLGKIL